MGLLYREAGWKLQMLAMEQLQRRAITFSCYFGAVFDSYILT
jgi:hypothetical protein